jgi:hypothetical protein
MNHIKDELIILGMGASRRQCPFNGIPVWSCNTGYLQIAEHEVNDKVVGGYVQKIFMSHPEHYKSWALVKGKDGKVTEQLTHSYNIEQMNILVDKGIEIINTHRNRTLRSKVYPMKTIDKKFNAKGFFSNTISYMLAYAVHIHTKVDKLGRLYVHDGFRKIWIYGVDMLTKDEYELEKGGIEYWIGYAQGLGIEVEVSPGSAVCTTCTGRPYGDKFFDMKNIDPWGLLKSGKKRLLVGQAGFNKKQIQELNELDTEKIAKIPTTQLNDMTR